MHCAECAGTRAQAQSVGQPLRIAGCAHSHTHHSLGYSVLQWCTGETDQIFKSVWGPVSFTVSREGAVERRVDVTIETSAAKKDCVVWNPWIGKQSKGWG